MPKKSSAAIVKADTAPELGTEEKLDEIIRHVANLDRRDRIRTIAMYINTFFKLAWLFFIFWSMWYFFAHIEDIVGALTEQTTRSMLEQSQGGNEALMEQFREMLGQ